MKNDEFLNGLNELRDARRKARGLYWSVAIFSIFANLLMLSGPLYMLQVYDRVLGSRSIETLVALTVLIGFLYGTMGILDFVRGRVLARIGARFQASLDKRVFNASITRSARGQDERAQTAMADLESIQKFIASPFPIAMFDMPWTPIFLVGISIFHPWLGYLAVVGGAFLILLTLSNQRFSRGPLTQANLATHRAGLIGEQIRSEAEMVQSLGMRDNAFDRWHGARADSLTQQVSATDVGGGFTSVSKTFRLFLQSSMLGLGAYLVLHGQLTPGAMIAGSILLGRALAPIEMAIGSWPIAQRAHRGWWNLAQLLTEAPDEPPRTRLPDPRALLDVQSITMIPPEERQASLRMVTFSLKPGQALGVIGPSGAGKSTLARAITGTWRPAGGKVRLDGASLEQYTPSKLGEYIGYLPQRVQLFDGTIADNIARLSPTPDPDMIVKAAKKADAHDMILKLPNGYDTQVSATGGRLSGGQIQRIGLARALYSDPVLLVLDEPNSNLDNQGADALNAAIRNMKADGKSVIIMAHRPAAIRECDLLLKLQNGTMTAFGPRDDVLRKVVTNHQEIQKSHGGGGVQ
jgi:ATP-binding cassette subfamily C protein